MSTICNAAVPHCLWSPYGGPLHHVFSDASSKKHQCPSLNFAAHVASSLALCIQVSVWPFFVQSMSLNIDKIMIPSSKGSGFRPFRKARICFFILRVEAPGYTCQTNWTSRAAKFNCSSHPVFVPYFIQFC